MSKNYIEQVNENTKEYYSILSEDFPQFLNDYIYTPEMQKLDGINQICGAYKDFGTNSTASVDYPDYAHPLALAVESGECYPGIAICGSGNGINMTLNKHQGIRAALCWNAEIAHLARQHNDANVLVMPGRFISTEEADMILTEFFSTKFDGGRHQNRIDKIPVK